MYAGRFDAREDLPTLLNALALLSAEPAPAGAPSWPPRVCVVGATPDDRASLSRAAVKAGVADAIAYAPALPDERLAALISGARFALEPALADAGGVAAMEALAAGVPVIASAVGALPEVIGAAGILVEPGDAARLATAIRAVWTDNALHRTLCAAVAARAETPRTWADVARETRAVWAEAARPAPLR